MSGFDPKKCLSRRELLATGATVVGTAVLCGGCSNADRGYVVLTDVQRASEAAMDAGADDAEVPPDDVPVARDPVVRDRSTTPDRADMQTADQPPPPPDRPPPPPDMPLPPNVLVVRISQHSALANVGGSVVIQDSRVNDYCGIQRVIVFRTGTNTFKATDAGCTHQCCIVRFQNNQLFCPCHRATFDLNGAVTGGPANFDLNSYPTTYDGNDTIQVAL